MRKSHDVIALKKNHKNQLNKSRQNEMNKLGYNLRRIWRYLWSEGTHLFHNYCETTANHGFRNIPASRLLFEKIVWATICFTATAFAMILIRYYHENMSNRLILMQLTNENMPLNRLNFPAVTVCNYNKVNKDEANAMASTLLDAGYNHETIQYFFNNLSLLVRPSYIPQEPEKFNNMIYLLDSNLKNLMFRLMQPCDKLLKSCNWNGNSYNCSLLFKTVDSFLGHCCGFNYHVVTTYADENKSPECLEFYDKYNSDKNIHCDEEECPGRKVILKTPGTGIDVGLKVELDIQKDQYLAATRDFFGVNIIIHEPFDYPETNILTSILQRNQETNILLRGQEIESHDDIRLYKPIERQCIFRDEVGHPYSYESCITGCKMLRMSQACGCIPYFYPVTCINISKTCDFNSVTCIQKNLDIITKIFEEVTLSDGQFLEKCKCESECSSTKYYITIDKNNRVHTRFWMNATSKFNIYFQEYGYMKYTRMLYTSWNEIVANYGGILGLCLGGSLISLMEPLIYFLTTPFRVAHHRQIRQQRAAQKQAKEESMKQFQGFPPASKFRRVSLDKKLLKECQENKNVFDVGSDLEKPEYRRRNKPHSKNVELFRKHFL